MSKNNSNSKSGIGFFGLLQLAFIILKLCKVIDWSWWLVLLPIIIPLATIIVCLILLGVVKLLGAAASKP